MNCLGIILIILIDLIYLVCGYYAAGYDLANNQTPGGIKNAEKEGKDNISALIVFLAGFMGLAVMFFYDQTKNGRLYPWQGSRWQL